MNLFATSEGFYRLLIANTWKRKDVCGGRGTFASAPIGYVFHGWLSRVMGRRARVQRDEYTRDDVAVRS